VSFVPATSRLVLEDRVELPRLYLAWHGPRMFAPGDAEVDLVADLVGNGKTSRLYKSLVYQRRVATEVAAFQQSRELAGFFQIVATAAPGHTLDELEAVIVDEVARLADEGPTADELSRVQAQAEAQFVYRLQTVGGFGGKSDQLNAYNVFLDDPGFFERDLARYLAGTPAAIAAATAQYLQSPGRVSVSVVPSGRLSLALADSEPAVVH
jgi:zinc protease